MTSGFGVRLLVVSIFNYLFGNCLFAVLWAVLGDRFKYWGVALLCTCISAIFSFQSQVRFVLRQTLVSFINFRFVSFQLLGLTLGIFFVPKFADFFNVSIVIIQFGWTAMFSLLSLLMLMQKRFDSQKRKIDSCP